MSDSTRTDNNQPDPQLTREFLESYVQKHVLALEARLRRAKNECHYAWFRTMETGEKVGYIMYGNPDGSGYCDVEGLFAFVEGTNERIGRHVAEILTPSLEAEAEFQKLTQEADWDYTVSGGNNAWWVPNSSLKIGKADAYRLLANLPKAGSSKK